MSQALGTHGLLKFAEASMHSAQAGHLGDIYSAVATLFTGHAGTLSQRERLLATDILRKLTKDVEMAIRIALAERLAESDSAPHELLMMLTDDHIDVAAPILMRSPLLADADLVRVVETGSSDHQIVVARRPHLGETVTATLTRHAAEPALIELLRNRTAKIGPDSFGILVERSRMAESLREPLVLRPDLPPVLATSLYGWVSQALQDTLVERFPVAAAAVAAHMGDAAAKALIREPAAAESTAIKLVKKMAAAGQLRSSFLIRVLSQGEMDLFEHGLAALLHMDVVALRRALYGHHAVPVALACRAVGIDRAVFMTVHNLSRQHRGHPANLTKAELSEVDAIFAKLSKSEALRALKTSILS